MRIKKFLCAALAIAGLMMSAEVNAQGSQSTTRWVGTDYQQTTGKTVFLYNVGTGRFLVHGGDWGTQARLFNEDYGKSMTPTLSSGRYILKTGVNTGEAAVLGCNVPQITSGHAWKGNNDQETFTILMDANENYSGTNGVSGQRGWNFIRVGEGDGTFTYYMYETLNGTNYWLGAAYGENGPADATPGNGHEGDPVGKLALLASGYDKAVWSTADPRTNTEYACQLKSAETAYLSYDDATAQTVNRSMQTEVRVFNEDTYVPLNDLYKWRIVTEEQFLATLNMSDFGDGLSTNLTWEITDRGFERNDNNFFDNTIGWKTGRVSGVTYPTSNNQRRYGYTWGLSGQSTNNQTGGSYANGRGYNEPWNAPVRLKTQWVHKENAKYGFMEFEGAGTASTYITAPVAGVYRISCYGFYQGSNAGYLFATTTNPQGTTAVNPSNFITTDLKQVSTAPYRNQDKDEEGSVTRTNGTYSGSGVMFAGATFVNDFPDKDDFYREVTITVNKDDKIYFGVGKNGAVQSSADVTNYYHDTEYVGVDQFNIHYLGTDDPIMFDEDKYNWDYLPATPANADTRYRTIRLKRTFKTGQWNSFVFPYNMTAVQIRQAFGDQTRVAELDGLGTITTPESAHNADVIDFKTVELPSEGAAITAHKFYLIKPSQALPAEKNYYDMGTQIYKKESLPTSVETMSYGIGEGALNAEGHNTIISKATYWATTDYDNFNNNNLSAVTNKVYAPAKSYVISDSKMYYIKNPNRIKGFRGWIEDVPASSNTAKLALNGIIDDNEISGLEDILTDDALPVLTNGSAIYDLSGRKVAVDTNQLGALPKGMYIVNGKKYIVK